MDQTTILTVVGSVIAALTSTKAWDYYAKRAEKRDKEKIVEDKEKNLYRDDLKDEVSKLREELKAAYKEKEDQMVKFQEEITQLAQDLAAMRVRVEFLEKENQHLRDRLAPLELEVDTEDN